MLHRSLSYILVLSSMAFVLMATFYNIIDVQRLWSGIPFTYPGIRYVPTDLQNVIEKSAVLVTLFKDVHSIC